MAHCPVLIFCANGNRPFSEIALATGFRLGARLPATVYEPLYFADQDWHRPNRRAYMAALADHRPHMATVLDWEREEQLAEILDWAEEAAQYVQQVLIVPKVVGGLARLPRQVGSREVVLAYSVPTRYGASPLPLWEFAGWPVHLLGGSPQAQMQCWAHLTPIAEITSADSNVASRMATRCCMIWMPGTSRDTQGRYWSRLCVEDGKVWGRDAPYEAFRRSCANILAAWRRLTDVPSHSVPARTLRRIRV